MLWWFAYNIPDSGVSEYSTTDTSNSGVGKYYVTQKKMKGVADSSSLNKPNKNKFRYMHAYFFIFLFFFYFYLYFYFFIIYVFGAGSSSTHMGWARPSQPSPVTGPSQWPAGPQHAWFSFMRAWHCAKVINYLRTVLNALKFRNKNEEEEKAYLATGCFAGVLACWAKISGGVHW